MVVVLGNDTRPEWEAMQRALVQQFKPEREEGQLDGRRRRFDFPRLSRVWLFMESHC